MRIGVIAFCLLLCGITVPAPAAPVDTSISYQGQLKYEGRPADGSFDFRFLLYSASSGGSPLSTVIRNDLPVNNGLFSTTLNFTVGLFNGDALYVEVEVRPGASVGAYTPLTPRQAIVTSPYALYSLGGPGSGGPWTQDGNNVYNTNSGSVGIGITSATAKLVVYGAESTSFNNGVFQLISPGGVLGNVMTMDGDEINGWSHLHVNPDAATDIFMVEGGGRVGIGTDAPEAILHVHSGSAGPVSAHGDSVAVFERSDRAFISLVTPNTTDRGILFGDPANPYDGGIVYNTTTNPDGFQFRTGGNLNRMVITNAGNIGIGTTAPATKLHVNGTARCDILEVDGADVAERFPVSEEVQPGMVVMIDADHPGSLCLARGAYNRRVAGVVSGANDLAPGTILGNRPSENNGPPVALSGRVWVQADVTHEAIEPGDLLTTSETAGHAMKVVDFSRAHGATIGKAMTSLAKGASGQVMVLVNLQ